MNGLLLFVCINPSIHVTGRVRNIKDVAELYTSDQCAHAIIRGGVSRKSYIEYPKKQVRLAKVFMRVFPTLYEKTMRKLKAGHPCASYPDVLKPITCAFME